MDRPPQLPRTVDWAREAPRDELDPLLCEAHAANEVADDLRRRAELAQGNAVRTLFTALGAGIAPGRVGDGGHRAEEPASSRRPGGCAAVLIGILVLVSPILGIAGFLSGIDVRLDGGTGFSTAELDPDAQIALSIVGFWVALLIPLGTLVLWLRHGRVRERILFGLQAYVIVFAAVALVALHSRGLAVLDLGEPAVLPVWIAAGLAAAVLPVLALCSRAPVEEETAQRIVLKRAPDLHRVDRSFAQLPEPVRRQLLDARNSGVRVLAERGLVTEASAAAAAELPFGSLRWEEPRP